MKKSFLLTFIFALALVLQAYAQGRTVTGRVVSAADGSPLPGVAVVLKGTTTGTGTDADGRYSLAVPANGGTLMFSYLGYNSQEVAVGNQSTVNVSLAQSTTNLSEVVVTGYGKQERREVTGAISSVSAEVLENLPMQSFDRAMQGRAAGVQVTSQSGQPGAGISVTIRGTSTINGSTQPLYIIDGVQVSGGTLSTQAPANVLASINPEDIESIEILKDAAAASIYGSQAGNGVVIVTTKRGKAGATKFKASVQHGITEAYNPYETVNATEWIELRKEAYGNLYKRVGLTYDAGSAFAVNQYFGAGGQPASIPSYDWVRAVLRTGSVKQYDLSLSGGDAKTRFFLSTSLNSTEGTVLRSDYNRGTIRANFDHKINDKFSVESVLSLTGSKSTGPTTGTGFFINGAFTGGLYTPSINPIYNEDGTYNVNLIGTNFLNIVQNIELEERESIIAQTVSNLAFNYDIIPGLRARIFGGIDFSDVRDRNYRPASIPAGGSGGTAFEAFRRNINYQTNATLNYNKKLNEVHNVGALIGAEYRSVEGTVLSANGAGFASPRLPLLSQAATPSAVGSSFTGYKNAGIFTNLKYDYKDKYLVSGTLRYDGSSRFGKDVRYGLFYGISGGWRVSEEAFMESLTFLDDLKIRLSYGEVGVQPTSNFGALGLYGGGGEYLGQPGLRPAQLANPNLTWEESAQVNLGLDYAMFNNRVYGSFDIYRKKTTELLLDRQLAGDTGFNSILENGGEIEAEGIDFELSTVNVDAGGFKWNTTFNISFVENKLISLNAGRDRIGNTYIVGQPLNVRYTYDYAGVNPADGRPFYYDRNGNLTYQPIAADQKQVGDGNPDFFGGLNNSFSYKGLSLDVFFQYQYGGLSFLQAAQILETAGSGETQQAKSQLDRWTTPGQITWVPAPYQGTEPGVASRTLFSTRYLEEASYIRLKQLSLNYKLPTSLTSRANLGGVSVFVQAINLATYTNFRGDDPENAGNNLGAYPNPRSITGGLTVNF
jgi:TonB-dependent starch-binding outer membrane protein SusC